MSRINEGETVNSSWRNERMTIFHLHSARFESKKAFRVPIENFENDNLTSSLEFPERTERNVLVTLSCGGEEAKISKKPFFTFFDSSTAHSENTGNF